MENLNTDTVETTQPETVEPVTTQAEAAMALLGKPKVVKIKKIHPLINDLAAPVKTILGSYASQTDINDLRLYKNLLEIYKGDTTYVKINLYKSGETETYPMNWSISDQSLKKMNERLFKHEPLNSLIRSINEKK